MTNEEMKRALEKGGVAEADIEKVSDRFDADKITELVEAANTPEEAFAAIHAVYPELAVSELEKQCDFMREQLEATMKEQKKSETVELSEDELENVAGGGLFDSIGGWFKDNWKKVAVGAAIVVGAALICTGVGAGIGAVVAHATVAAQAASLTSTLATAGIAASISSESAAGIIAAITATGAGIGAGVGTAVGGAVVGGLAGTDNLPC